MRMARASCGIAMGIVLLAGAAAAQQAGRAASATAQVKARGKLVVLSFPHTLSSFVKQVAPGTYQGIDHDLMRAFAARLGVAMEIRPVAHFDDLIPDLLAGRGDVVASSFSITAARRRQVTFSEPYFPVLLFGVARKGGGIAAAADARGRSACVVAGSSQEERLGALGDVRRVYVDSSAECWGAVEDGRADFTLLDSTAVLANLPAHPDLVHAFQLPEVEHYGFAVAPGSDLQRELDAFLQESRRSGFLYQVVERHFGSQGRELFRLAREN
jgi:ABC-type amino acid transport substrate-binding protein